MSLAENVTSPQSRSGNYEVARFNALRHGVLSRHTVLPWEVISSRKFEGVRLIF